MPDNSYPPQGGQGFPQDNPDGTPGLVGKDEYTKWEATQRINKPHSVVLAGNYADLQRMGAEAAVGKAAPGIVAHPTIDTKSDNVITPAQQEAARGEYTLETQRVGLLGPPPVNTNPGSGAD